MRVNEGFTSGSRIDRPNGIDPSHVPAPSVRSLSQVSQDAIDTSSARELAQLVAAVNATDEVRPGLVEDVSNRLAAGDYETRDAAERTADAILQTAD